jgi:hypothetical protein
MRDVFAELGLGRSGPRSGGGPGRGIEGEPQLFVWYRTARRTWGLVAEATPGEPPAGPGLVGDDLDDLETAATTGAAQDVEVERSGEKTRPCVAPRRPGFFRA